jgi:regulator of sigma E protease
VTFLIAIPPFIVVFSLMVFAHEFGHFIVGKKAGVRVREFGFGFPLAPDKPPGVRPLSWKIGEDKDGTVYSFNLIPFGGFVNLGENDPDDPDSLAHFPKRVRLAALLAGPLMNLVLAFLIFAVAALVGYPMPKSYGIGVKSIAEGSPAEAAGIQLGDIIIRVGDLSLEATATDWEGGWNLVTSMVDYVATKADQETVVLVQRGLGADAERIEFLVTPRADENGDGKIGVGIQPDPVSMRRVHASFLDALKYALDQIVYIVYMTFSIPIQVLRGLLPASTARSVGPAGIAMMTSDAVQQSIATGWAWPILQLVGVLNVAIAITNLLPLPALDGGRISFILLEAIRGKPVPPEKEGMVHGIGLMVLLLFLVVVTIQDFFVPLPPGTNWADYFP